MCLWTAMVPSSHFTTGDAGKLIIKGEAGHLYLCGTWEIEQGKG